MNIKAILVIISLLAFYSLCQKANLEAIAYLTPTNDHDGISGTVLFVEEDDGSITVEAKINGIKSEYVKNTEKIGLHVHEKGNLDSNDGTAAGSHYIGNGKDRHGCPDDPEGTHAGDMGNFDLEEDGGVYKIDHTKTNKLIKMKGLYSIIGRSVVLHQNEDDCSDVTSAGKRLAVGVIGLRQNVVVETTTQTIVKKAVCVMSGVDGNDISGKVTLEQSGKKVKIVADIDGLPNDKHAFHIHEFGDIMEDGSAVGGHYNPHEKDHGLPENEERHVGDLGNIVDNEYNGEVELSLSGKYGVVGRSMIIHEKADTGVVDFGDKLAQCVIGIEEYEDPSDEDENEDDEDDTTSNGFTLTVNLLLLLLIVAFY